jgi:hypothetical protein
MSGSIACRAAGSAAIGPEAALERGGLGALGEGL